MSRSEIPGTFYTSQQVSTKQYRRNFIHKLWQRPQISSRSSKQGNTKRINQKFATEGEFNHICVLPYNHVISVFLSDIWSRSNFRCGWVTVHTSRVPMSAKQSIVYSPIYTALIYRLNQWLLLQMLASFARSYMTDPVWVILMIFVAQNCIWNFRASRPWIITDKLWNERTLSTLWDQS